MTMKVWVVDDDESIRWVLERALQAGGMAVQTFPGAVEVLDALEQARPDVVMTDIRMKGIDGLELLSRVHAVDPDMPVIVMTAHSDLDAAVAAYQGGAFEYLPKPFDVDEAVELVQRAQLSRGHGAAAAPEPITSAQIVGEAPAMQEVFRAIGRLAKSQITVLITGESGTGKELVARALHAHSPRAQQPFIAINTAAIPKDLMESEFFGHERGAFTGATAQRAGRFEQADGGTLFLDEVAELPLELQPKLLRVLEERCVTPVGATRSTPIDVRIVAATHASLRSRVAAGRFREDLMFRLRVVPIYIPPLRDRRRDISVLLWRFIGERSVSGPRVVDRIAPDAMQALLDHRWSGNVRELRNVIDYAFAVGRGPELQRAQLPPELRDAVPVEPLVDDEATRIAAALRATGGHIGKAAARLGISRPTLWRRRKKYGL